MRSPGTAAVRGAALVAGAGALNAVLNSFLVARPPADPPECAEAVAVCVPARDEEATIGALLGDLRVQTGVPHLRVHVLDDASRDRTAAVVRAVAAVDERVRLHPGTPPAPGWLGKPAACQALAGYADADEPAPTVVVFADADVRLAPHAVAASVALLRRHGLDMVSPWPRQLAGSGAERLVQPLQQWSWLTTVPLRVAERSQRAAFAAANGQFLVLDAAAYRRVGCHRAVAGEVIEDVALARVLRRAGGRTAPAAGSAIARCRMYAGGAALRAGYGKSLWSAFGSPAGALAVSVVLGWVYLLPPVAVVVSRGPARRWGVLGVVAGVASRAVAARVAGTRVWPDSAAHPVSVLALVSLTADSFRGHRRGTLRWKGRQVG